MSDAIKAAEQNGYAKGYNAGLRKKKKKRAESSVRARRDANWDRAFLAALPPCIEQQGWTCGEKLINSLEDRVALAKDFADEAIRYLR